MNIFSRQTVNKSMSILAQTIELLCNAQYEPQPFCPSLKSMPIFSITNTNILTNGKMQNITSENPGLRRV